MMKHVTNKMRRVVSICLTLAMALTVLAAVPAQAATKKSITLYKGEGIYYTDYTAVKSVKSSNSKVVTAKKDKSADYKTNLLAKKAGKSTVSIRTKSGSHKVTVTVKNAKFTPEILSCNAGGYVLISVKNNNKDTFDKVAIKYTIKSSDGSVIAEKEDTVSYLLAGKTAYTSVYVGSSNLENVSLAQSTVKVTDYARTWIGYTYKDVSAKVKCTAEVTEETDSSLSYNIKEKNTTKENVSGKLYTMIYDADNHLIGVESSSLYLNKQETKTLTYGYISKRYYPNYDHMKLVVHAYAVERAKNF